MKTSAKIIRLVNLFCTNEPMTVKFLNTDKESQIYLNNSFHPSITVSNRVEIYFISQVFKRIFVYMIYKLSPLQSRSPISVTAIFSSPSIIVPGRPVEIRGFPHIHARSGRMRSLSGGEIDADPSAVEVDSVALIPGFAGVVQVLEGDETESATPAGHPVINQSDAANATVARENGLYVVLGGSRIQIENSQTLVFRGRIVSAETGRTSHWRSRSTSRSPEFSFAWGARA